MLQYLVLYKHLNVTVVIIATLFVTIMLANYTHDISLTSMFFQGFRWKPYLLVIKKIYHLILISTGYMKLTLQRNVEVGGFMLTNQVILHECVGEPLQPS